MKKEDINHYYRTIQLENIKEEGQEKLLSSSILVIGAGGLGSSVITFLTTLGLGNIGIVDYDVVSLNNLPRQVLYDFKDIGKYKVNVARSKMKKKNPDVNIKTYRVKLDKNNAKRIFKSYDIIIDCVDNFETKFLIDDICVKLHKPFISAGVSGYQGQVLTYIPNKSKDFKSLFDELPHDLSPRYIDNGGVFPSAVGVIANIEVIEAVKLLLNIGEPLINQLLVIDLLNMKFQKIKI